MYSRTLVRTFDPSSSLPSMWKETRMIPVSNVARLGARVGRAERGVGRCRKGRQGRQHHLADHERRVHVGVAGHPEERRQQDEPAGVHVRASYCFPPSPADGAAATTDCERLTIRGVTKTSSSVRSSGTAFFLKSHPRIGIFESTGTSFQASELRRV